MRVSGRILVLAVLVSAFGATRADAAPFLLSGDRGASCGTLVSAGSVGNCGLFDITLGPATSLDGTFENEQDIALFRFVVTGVTEFNALSDLALTGVVDAFVGLFDGDTTEMLSVQAPLSADPTTIVTAEGAGLPDTLLIGGAAARTYILAILHSNNSFGFFSETTPPGFDTLLAPLANEAEELWRVCEGACGFSLNLTALTEGGGEGGGEEPASVPEPGSLALVGTGLALMLSRSRVKKGGRAEGLPR